MGLFDNVKTGATVTGARNDDGPGTYWQRIDKVQVVSEKDTNSGRPFLRITKTNLHVIHAEPQLGKSPKGVGEQTTQAIFNDPRYHYFERDLKRLAQAIFGLSDSEANALPLTELNEMVTTKADTLRGVVLEASVNVKPKSKKPGETFAEVTYKRRVSKEEIAKTLPPNRLKEFFPAA
jgi:hypothetical protein